MNKYDGEFIVTALIVFSSKPAEIDNQFSDID